MKLASFMSRYLPLFVVADITLAVLIGNAWPEVDGLKVLIPFLLFAMLYPMMINLKVEFIGKALKNPKVILIAIGLNFLLTPLLGALWANIFFSGADPYLSLGFILKVVMPCSGMVAAWTGFSKGRVETALVIIALSLLLAIVLVPLWMLVLSGEAVDVNPGTLMQSMFLIVVLPLTAGLITRKLMARRLGEERFKSISQVLPAVSSMGMLAMVFVIISSQAATIIDNLQWVALIILGIASLYPILFSISFILSRITKISYGDAMALAFSVTAKNHAITIGVATTAFSGTLAVLPAAVAPLVQLPIMLGILRLAPWISRRLPAAGD